MASLGTFTSLTANFVPQEGISISALLPMFYKVLSTTFGTMVRFASFRDVIAMCGYLRTSRGRLPP